MRIVHTCLRYPPATGGVETYVHELVERTRNVEAQRDVRVLTSTMRTHGPITQLTPEAQLHDPPYVQRLLPAATLGISYPRLQSLRYYLAHHRPDIIHGYSFWYQPADVAARYAHRQHIPFIFHPMYYENEVRQKPLWQIYRRTIGQRTFVAADAVVVLSQFEKQLIERAGFPIRRYVTITPGIALEPYTIKRSNPFAAHGITGTILLAVSRLSAGKGIDDILTALASLVSELPDVQLVVIGEDFGELIALKQRAAVLNVADHVHWWQAVTSEDLVSAYQYADLFVHGSHYEAFGIVLLEAMAAGLPVVARRVAAIPEVVPPGTGELFSSQEELVSVLRKLLVSPAARTKYKDAARVHARRYTWQASVDTLLSLYDELNQSSR